MIKELITTTALRAFNVLAGLASTAMFIRLAGIDIFGYFVFLSSLISVIAVIFRLGMDNIIVTSLASATVSESCASAAVRTWFLFVGSLSAVTILSAVLVFPEHMEMLIVWVCAICQAFVMLIGAHLRGCSKQVTSIFLSETSITLGRLLILLFFSFHSCSDAVDKVDLPYWLLLAPPFLPFLYCFYFVFFRYHPRKSGMATFKQWVCSAWPLLHLALFNQTTNGVDMIVLASVWDDSLLGTYGVVKRIGGVFLITISNIGTLSLPTLSKMASARDVSGLRKTIRKYAFLGLILWAVGAIAMFILEDDILRYLSVSEDLKLEIGLIILLLGTTSVFGPTAMLLVALDEKKSLRNTSIITNIFCLLLIYTLGLIFGVLGAILGYGLYHVLLKFFCYHHARRVLSSSPP